jgi:hypothetical protein
MKSFAEFLAEQEKLVKMYGSGQSPAKAMASVVKPSKPNHPFQGINVAKVFSKDGPARLPSGVIGGK